MSVKLSVSYNFRQKKRASTLMALAESEFQAVETLIGNQLHREAVFHMYFCSFYVSQAVLCDVLRSSPSHKAVESQLHRRYGRHKNFPRRYVKLHVFLHKLRNEFNYRATHSPSPAMVEAKARVLSMYLRYGLRNVPRVEVVDVLRGLYEANKDDIKNFSYDIYCPQTYRAHTRLTLWQPPFYLGIFTVKAVARHTRRMLASLRVRKHEHYVVGLNSKVNQYSDVHLLMLDIDSVDACVESALRPIGGILVKSGRGFHFIGNTLIKGRRAWERQLRKLRRHKDLKKYIDQKFVTISLQRGYTTLRLTESPAKPVMPFFYKELK